MRHAQLNAAKAWVMNLECTKQKDHGLAAELWTYGELAKYTRKNAPRAGASVYSAGLRVSEAIRLKPEHIESDPSRMMLRIEQGKGRKDRYTVLSERLLCELREYWQKYSPGQWLFPGQKPNSHITATSVSRALYRAKKKLRLPRRAACIRFDIHLLRIFYTTATTSIPSANFLVTPQ